MYTHTYINTHIYTHTEKERIWVRILTYIKRIILIVFSGLIKSIEKKKIYFIIWIDIFHDDCFSCKTEKSWHEISTYMYIIKYNIWQVINSVFLNIWLIKIFYFLIFINLSFLEILHFNWYFILYFNQHLILYGYITIHILILYIFASFN